MKMKPIIKLNVFKENLHPFEHVQGECSWDLGDELPKEISICLLWYTQQRHYTTYHTTNVVEKWTAKNPSKVDKLEFDFKMPGFPYSFDGELFCIGYAIEVSMDVGEPYTKIIQCTP